MWVLASLALTQDPVHLKVPRAMRTKTSWPKAGTFFLAGVASAFVLLAHKILMLDQVYGFYDPVHANPHGERVSAPLINENHMAALLGLAAAVAVGMAVSAREQSKRMLLILVAGLLGGSLLLTLSRGGIAAFVIGQLLFITMRLIDRALGRRRDEESKSQIAWLPLGLALSLALGLFVAQDAILGEFIGGSHKKIEMLSEGLPLIGKFPATGVGRGSFAGRRLRGAGARQFPQGQA